MGAAKQAAPWGSARWWREQGAGAVKSQQRARYAH
jgi:hypothetical protein